MNNPFAALVFRIEQLERRFANVVREGRVEERDPKKGIRVAFADIDGKPVLTPWIRPSEQGGNLKTFALPAKGQHMKLISPDGEIGRNTMAIPHTYTDEHGQPSEEADEPVWQVGDASIRIRNGQLTITVGGCTWAFTGTGFAQTGGTITHDDINIGKTHGHITAPPGPPGPPVP